jgi:glutathione S-transferase
VNINLKKKPDWFSDRTPYVGAVPILEHEDGRIVYESLIICEYLDTIYPEHRLTPNDPFVKAEHQFLIEMNSRLTDAFYKILRTKTGANDLDDAFDFFEKKLSHTFFGGKYIFNSLGFMNTISNLNIQILR